MTLSDVFELLRSALERADVRYAVGGSWASTAFGDPRFTNDIDVLADVTEQNLLGFLRILPETFYSDAEEALGAVRRGRPFNVIHMPTVLKFDFFPASGFPLGLAELDRALILRDTGLSKGPAPFVTPEDIVLAKLFWFRSGGEISQVQWRDIQGVLHGCASSLDHGYMKQGATTLGVAHLLNRALSEM